MNNVVQVVFIGDVDEKRYTFMVPYHVMLSTGDVVIVKNRNGKHGYAICVTDSEMLSDNAVNMIMCGRKVLSNVIAILKPQFFDLEPKFDCLVETEEK